MSRFRLDRVCTKLIVHTSRHSDPIQADIFMQKMVVLCENRNLEPNRTSCAIGDYLYYTQKSPDPIQTDMFMLMFVLCEDQTRDLLRSRRVFRPLRQIGRQLFVIWILDRWTILTAISNRKLQFMCCLNAVDTTAIQETKRADRLHADCYWTAICDWIADEMRSSVQSLKVWIVLHLRTDFQNSIHSSR
jgi:hypothetical protein